MIRLTRINHSPIILNSDLIEHVEMTPDTVISLVTGQKLMVLESADDVVERVREFKLSVHHCCPSSSAIKCQWPRNLSQRA